ncbi:MAG: metallophosphoesterase family protein [Bacteroidetes bacterium]|nr:metallophosphoesterase family protein [Bacteroidota bacterium]
MKILLLSDTHSHLDASILNYAREANEIWHSGDFGNILVSDTLAAANTLRGVYGNIDGQELRKVHPEVNFFEVQGLKVLIVHIGSSYGKYPAPILEKIRTLKPDIFICGHSHILKVSRDPSFNNMLCLNPGAAGKSGFHQFRTMIRMEIAEGKVKNLDVIELGKR